MTKTKEITLIALLSALCIASRVTLQFLPNIKPVTSIIIISTQLFGWRFGFKLAFCTTMVSNMLLGMGTWAIFQIFAWTVIAFLTAILDIDPKHKLLSLSFVFLAGYLFGFLVSFEKFLYGGLYTFIGYWLSGLFFDTLHAVGNVAFYPVCYYVMNRTLAKEVIR